MSYPEKDNRDFLFEYYNEDLQQLMKKTGRSATLILLHRLKVFGTLLKNSK